MSDEEKDEVTPDETTADGTEEEGDDKALPPGTSSRMASREANSSEASWRTMAARLRPCSSSITKAGGSPGK